jgi:PAS domain S-box-containing protein
MNKAITFATQASAASTAAPLDPHGLLAAMPWSVLLLEGPAGVVTFTNPATKKVWGLAPDELLGQPLLAVLPPAQHAALHELLAAPVPAQGECFVPHCGQWLALSTVQLAQGLALYAQDITAWRRTEAEAHEQAHLLASISNATPDLIYTLDLQTPCISYTNDRVLALLGYSPTQLAAQGAAVFTHLLHPDDYAPRMRQMQAYATLTEDEVRTQEVRLRLADGEYQWFRLRDRVFRRGAAGQVTHTIGIAQDIGAEREAATLLAQQHALLLGIFAGSQVGLSYQQAVRDAQGQLVDFRLQRLNPASLVGSRQPAPAADELLSEALPQLRQHPAWAEFEAALASGQATRLETYYQHHSVGAWLDVSITPLGDGLILSSLDISARKQAELELQRKNSILEAVHSVALTGLQVLQCVRDSAGELQDFEWVYATRAAEELLGLGPLAGQRQAATLATAPRLATWAQQVQVLETGQPVEYEISHPLAGAARWLRVLLVPFGDGLVLAFEDITARKAEAAAVSINRLQLQQTLDALPQMVWTRLPTGEPLFFNARWHAYTGFDKARSHSAGWQAAIHPDDLPRLLARRAAGTSAK